MPTLRPLLPALLALIFIIPGLSGQIPDDIFEEEPVSVVPPIPDRIEPVNRFFFRFNDRLYRVALRPLANGYTAVVPEAPRRGIGNFFTNLRYPERLAGNLLQGKAGGAWIETQRFILNTVAGAGGFFAIADKVPDLRLEQSEDLGRAFGAWGIGHGTYLVIPVLGPSSARDGVGDLLATLYLYPPRYLNETEYRLAVGGLDSLNSLPGLMDDYFTVRAAAIDPYIAVRDFYTNLRASRPTEAPDDLDEPEENDEIRDDEMTPEPVSFRRRFPVGPRRPPAWRE